MDVGRNGLAIAGALVVRPSTVDLEVWVGMLAAEDARGLRQARVELGGILLLLLLLLLGEVRLRVGRRQIRLAFLQVLNLARRVLRAHEAAVETSYFVALSTGDQHIAGAGWGDDEVRRPQLTLDGVS